MPPYMVLLTSKFSESVLTNDCNENLYEDSNGKLEKWVEHFENLNLI